jgi:hypothetical protein
VNSLSTRDASLPLRFHPDIIFPDRVFQSYLLHRLNLPSDPHQSGTCECGGDLRADPGHFHSCRLAEKRECNIRHDMINSVICRLAREAGCTVMAERSYSINFSGPDSSSVSSHLRPDCVIFHSAGTTWVDVSVTHPLAPSIFPTAARAPLAAAESRARAKISKYGDWPTRYGARFLPFVLDTFGGLSSDSLKVLDILAGEAEANGVDSRPSFLARARRELSLALVRGNSIVETRGALSSRVFQRRGAVF